jgi:hypothetical protein
VLVRDGIRDPLVTWRGILVDGHTRHEIATRLGLEFTTQELRPSPPDRAAVKAWIVENQCARRNLTLAQRIVMYVRAGAPRPPIAIPTEWELAQRFVAAGHDIVFARSFVGMRSRLGELAPRKPRTPIVAGAAPAPAAPPDPTDLRLDKAEAARRAAEAEASRLRERLLRYEQSEDFYSQLRPVVVAPALSQPRTGKREATPIAVASDWHFGEVVTTEETLGRNEYNLEIAARRASNYWDHVMWLRKDAQRTQTARDQILILGGDMISGSIHPELAATNESGLADQVQACYDAIMPGVRALAADSERLIIPCVSGNHGRITEKSQIKDGWANSLETLLYRMLREGSRDLGNVEWLIPRAEGLAIEVMNRKIQIQHGTQIRTGGGIGGILVPLTRWATRAASADLYVFGHFHQAQFFDSVIVNGSLIGESAYSKWLGLAYREPEQVWWMQDATRGVRRFERVSVT